MAKLSPSEATELVLRALQDYQRIHGIPPSRRELSDLTRISVGALTHRLHRMEIAGLVSLTPGMARGIRIMQQDSEAS